MRNKDIDIGNLFFLLSIAPLAAGCPSDDTGGTEGASSTGTGSTSIEPPPGDSTTAAVDDTGTGTTSDATSSSAGPEDTGTSTSADTSSGGESSSSSGGESSSSSGGESSSSSGGESSSTTGSSQTPCEAYAAQIALCYGDPTLEPLALAYCTDYLTYFDMQYGAACVSAFEDLLVCISNLSCMELMSGMPVCPAEGMAFEMVCV